VRPDTEETLLVCPTAHRMSTIPWHTFTSASNLSLDLPLLPYASQTTRQSRLSSGEAVALWSQLLIGSERLRLGRCALPSLPHPGWQ
jgi:hypothetical protein